MLQGKGPAGFEEGHMGTQKIAENRGPLRLRWVGKKYIKVLATVR
jgi:hypothetical protein